MVKRKKVSKPKRKSIKEQFSDERIPKMVGLFLVLAAIYLLIAFTSYLFTWETDFDKVMRHAWSILSEADLEISNWLGKLGAIASHQFFYWWIGLPSYIIVFLAGITGAKLVTNRPISQLFPIYRFNFVMIIWLAVFLEFVAGADARFPWGGTLGEAITDWLYDLIGVIGTFILLLFTIIFGAVWGVNPKFEEMNWERIKYELKIILENNLPNRFHKNLGFIASTYEPTTTAKPPKSPKALKPSQQFLNNKDTDEDDELELKTVKQGEQLAFDLEQQRKKQQKPQSLNKGDDALEIVTPKVGDDIDADTPLAPVNNLKLTEENKKHVEPYDPTLELASYEYPHLQLLETYESEKIEIDRAELETNKDQIIETLLNYKIEITKIKATIGPTVTLYEIIPAPGVRISRIKNLEDDIALSLAALGIRIIAPIPGRGTIGIEVPNKKPQIVSLREVLQSEKFKRAKMDLPIALGKTISNEVFVADLAKMPHLLIAGATGQGKSVGINTVLMSLLYKKHPSQVKLVLIDPKKVELSLYSRLENHFLGYLPGEDEPIVTETKKVVNTLNSLCIEMDKRYELLKKAHVRNLKEYNQKFVQRRLNPEKGHEFMPYIVLIIDEFADMIMTAGKEVELPIGRLAQLARAVGIHLIIATQRPSVNIITGVIKANFPARIAYKVASKIDSRTILDGGGAEQLIGRGDMLLSQGGNTLRLQCAFVDTHEVENVIKFISTQRGYPEPFFLPEYNDDDGSDDKSVIKFSDFDENFEDAARLVVQNQHGSTSMIQRRLKLGYNRAGRIMDQLEQVGIVGPNEGSKAREVLIFDEMELERFLEHFRKQK